LFPFELLAVGPIDEMDSTHWLRNLKLVCSRLGLVDNLRDEKTHVHGDLFQEDNEQADPRLVTGTQHAY